jgi:hypothetical protein
MLKEQPQDQNGASLRNLLRPSRGHIDPPVRAAQTEPNPELKIFTALVWLFAVYGFTMFVTGILGLR